MSVALHPRAQSGGPTARRPDQAHARHPHIDGGRVGWNESTLRSRSQHSRFPILEVESIVRATSLLEWTRSRRRNGRASQLSAAPPESRGLTTAVPDSSGCCSGNEFSTLRAGRAASRLDRKGALRC
jgi:hypothetical protein